MTRRRGSSTTGLPALAAATVLAAVMLLPGCAPLIVAGAAGTALLVTDRRSAAAQLDDATIESTFGAEATKRWGERAHVSATSYNGLVLLTGEVPDASAKSGAVAMARGIDRVRVVQDETVIAAPSELGSRTADAYVTSMVKTRFLEDTETFSPTHVKVVTDRRVVYLMGIVKKSEADAAARIAAGTRDVQRVVKVFEYLD